jgi:flagellin
VRINTNVSALNAWKNLSVTGGLMAKSLEKLSSGYRINKAADDAAGLAISEKMRAQTAGLKQAARNAQDGISLIQTAEGALNESHAILQRMRELMVQAGNGTNAGDDLDKIQEEIDQLVQELDGIASRTEFNGQQLLDGSLGATTANVGPDLADGTGALKIVDVTGAAIGAGYQVTADASADTLTVTSADGLLSQTIDVGDAASVAVGARFHFDKLGITLEAQATDISGVAGADGQFDVATNGVAFQIGANGNQGMSVSIDSVAADKLGSADIKMNAIDVKAFGVAATSFENQLAAIDDAISQVSSTRSELGAYQNRLEHTINNLQTASENLTAAESRIRDVDMALEMANFTRHQILQQAGTAMLAQANVQTQSVLKLLG